jgi:hypothetical protein
MTRRNRSTLKRSAESRVGRVLKPHRTVCAEAVHLSDRIPSERDREGYTLTRALTLSIHCPLEFRSLISFAAL